MIKIARFMFLFIFFVSLSYGCRAADKVVAAEFLSAGEFKLEGLDNKIVSLGDYRGKNTVLLIFWNSLCPYCRIALDSLKKDVTSLREMGVELLAINTGESKSRVDSFVKSHGLNFKVLLDQDFKVTESYDILGVPTYFIINKAGLIVSSGNSFPKEELKELTEK